MAQEVFERYEKKYLLDTPQYHSLVCEMVKWMCADQFGRHIISNIYFDTGNFELIRRSIEKPEYKEKVRLRAYGPVSQDSTVFAELKKKAGGIVYKRRAALKLKEARDFLYRGICPEPGSQIIKEIDYAIKRWGLLPKAFIAYDRLAFFGREDPELRVTFDRRIRGRRNRLDLAGGDFGTELIQPDQVLMEVKIPGAMPLWMSRRLSELSIFPVSYSKYGMYYKENIYKQGSYREDMMKSSGSWRLNRCGKTDSREGEEGGEYCA